MYGVRTPYIMFCFAGPAQKGEEVLQSFRAATKPRHDDVKARNYVALQKEGDGPALAEKAAYSKTGYVRELTPALVDAVIQEPGTIALILSGGAIADIAPTDTALAHRSEGFLLQISAEWRDASQNDQKRAEVHAVRGNVRGNAGPPKRVDRPGRALTGKAEAADVASERTHVARERLRREAEALAVQRGEPIVANDETGDR